MTKIRSSGTIQGASAVPKANSQDPNTSTSLISNPKRTTRQGSSREQLIVGFHALGIDYHQLKHRDSTVAERCEARLRHMARRAQKNLETIFQLALDYAPASSTKDNLDLDWLNIFTEHAEQISNPSMQQLWARILAAESVKPGSFTIRTLQILHRLTTRDAEVLTRAQSLTAFDAYHRSYKIMTGYYQKPNIFTWVTLEQPVQLNIARAGLSYPDLLTLSDLGILYATAIEGAEMKKGDELGLQFGSARIALRAKRKSLVTTYYKYTAQGEELLRLLPSANHEPFIQLLADYCSKDFSVKYE